MSLTKKDVENIAYLARLDITDDEIDEVATKLSKIIDFVEQLSGADTEAVPPMAHPLDMAQRFRADEITEANRREDFLANAPAVDSGLYLVPKVIE